MEVLIRLILIGLLIIIPVSALTGGAIFFRLVFLFAVIIIVFKIAHLTISKGFQDLEVRRNIINNKVFSGEIFEYEIVIENKKKFPIIFLLIKEILPKEFKFIDKERIEEECDCIKKVHKYAIYGFERIIRKNSVRIDKRGTYIVNDIDESIGDFFGIIDKSKKVKDSHEILVYPRVKELNRFNIKSLNVMGDNIVKRWIHNDPLYIKSIREYGAGDRMKDIHWKSSLKMNKLMAKEYDYTSDKEMVIIANIQSHKECFINIYEEIVERTISLSVSIADKGLKEGVAVGMWTNASTKSLVAGYIEEVPASINSMEKILELGARMDYVPRGRFSKLLMRKRQQFNTNAIYVVVTPYLDEECISILKKLSRRGINIKIADVSDELNLPSIQGIEKLECLGEVE